MLVCKSCGKKTIDRRLCQKGRGCRKNASINTPITVSIPVVTLDTPKLTNHIAFVLDESGSMAHLRDSVIQYYNDQIANIKQKAYETRQTTYINLYMISGKNVKTVQRMGFVEQATFLTQNNYYPSGGTPLIGGMMTAIRDLEGAQHKDPANTSFLVITITDGEENESSFTDKAQLPEAIRRLNGTDKWTFAFAGPQGSKQYLANFGIHIGNFTEWEQTRHGVQNFSHQTRLSTNSYYDARAKGVTSVKNFFTTDLSKVNLGDVQKLHDYNNQFRRLTVLKDCPIADFVKGNGYNYQVGKAFYELTKTEAIQDHKELAICHMKTGQIYGGREAKDLLKLPQGGTIKVKPGLHGEYKVFVQSTSMNRKVLNGTELLWKL